MSRVAEVVAEILALHDVGLDVVRVSRGEGLTPERQWHALCTCKADLGQVQVLDDGPESELAKLTRQHVAERVEVGLNIAGFRWVGDEELEING